MVIGQVEIRKGSMLKTEFNKLINKLVIDRCVDQPYPAPYGFIKNTLAEDGDPLDFFYVGLVHLEENMLFKVCLQGVILVEDNGVKDHKLLVKLENDYVDPITAAGKLGEIKQFLKTYKPGVKVLGVKGLKEAEKILKKSQKNFDDLIYMEDVL
jgi:inorganic pyrophosphatase